jgi:hypothetical protein
MLNELVAKRDEALNNYYLEDTVLNLGLYNRSVKMLSDYVNDYDVKFNGVIDVLAEEYGNIKREKNYEKIDISEIDTYNVNFDDDELNN